MATINGISPPTPLLRKSAAAPQMVRMPSFQGSTDSIDPNALMGNTTFKTAATVSALAGGVSFILWRMPAARQAVRNGAEKLMFWKKNVAPTSATRVKPKASADVGNTKAKAKVELQASESKLSAAPEQPSSSKPGKNPPGQSSLSGHRSAAEKQLSNVNSSRVVNTPPSNNSSNTPPGSPPASSTHLSGLRDKLPSRKNVVKWSFILGGTVAAVLLGRAALSRYGGGIPSGEQLGNIFNNAREAVSNKWGGLKGRLNNWFEKTKKDTPPPKTNPNPQKEAVQCAPDETSDVCYRGKPIPTEFHETVCESNLGKYINKESRTYLGNPDVREKDAEVNRNRPKNSRVKPQKTQPTAQDAQFTCEKMSNALKEIGYTKPINNINPESDLKELKKQFRKWSLKNHPDKNLNQDELARENHAETTSRVNHFVEFFENKHKTHEFKPRYFGLWGDKKLTPMKREQTPSQKKETIAERLKNFRENQQKDLEGEAFREHLHDQIEQWKWDQDLLQRPPEPLKSEEDIRREQEAWEEWERSRKLKTSPKEEISAEELKKIEKEKEKLRESLRDWPKTIIDLKKQAAEEPLYKKIKRSLGRD